MNSLQELYFNHITAVCKKHGCMEAAGALKKGFAALCEAETSGTPGVHIEPGWPDEYSGVDYGAVFTKCPYATEFFSILREGLEGLGTLVMGDPVCVGDGLAYPNGNMSGHLRIGGLYAYTRSSSYGNTWPTVTLRAPMTGRRRGMPVEYMEIGEFTPLGDHYEFQRNFRWTPRGFLHEISKDAPANQEVTVTTANMASLAAEIVERVKWFVDNKLDLDAAGSMVGMHRKWLSRRARNVTDTEVGRLFVERFRELAESTTVVRGTNWAGKPYEMHVVGIDRGSDLNKVGVNKMDIYATNGDPARPYTLRCTSDGYVVLVGHRDELDIESVVLTKDNWQEICEDVFREVCEIEKEGEAREERKKAAEAEREKGRVRCNREKVRAKFGDFLYKKFFDVVDEGELEGKTTDEIITDMRCAIAEDQSEYDLMKKQDMIRAGRA